MSKALKLFGIIALAAVIGLSFASCGGSSSPAGNGGITPVPPPANATSAPLGASISLGGEVVVWDWVWDPVFNGWRLGLVPFTQIFSEALTVTSSFTTGTIDIGGNFSMTLGTPPMNSRFPLSLWLATLAAEGFTNINASNPNIDFFYIHRFPIAGRSNSLYYARDREWMGASYDEDVVYIWVSEPTTITAYGVTWDGFRLNGINMAFQEGWNAILLTQREGFGGGITMSFFALPPSLDGFQWKLRGD